MRKFPIGSELKELKKYVELTGYSFSQIAFDLGYRSETTVYKWFKNKKIPKIALPSVRQYLEKAYQ